MSYPNLFDGSESEYRLLQVSVLVEGEEIDSLTKVTVNQKFNEHHTFEVRYLIDDTFGSNEKMLKLSNIKQHLGKSISIESAMSESAKFSFKGIITDVGVQHGDVSGSLHAVLNGYSPTILLDAGEHNNSFTEQGLSKIVKDTCSDVPSNSLAISVSPVKTAVLPYVAQYRESNFNFLVRLAAEYGEWFFYDGASLRFGKPNLAGGKHLEYGVNLIGLNLQLKVLPVQFLEAGYLAKENKSIEASSKSQQVAGLDTFGKGALDASDALFNSKPLTLAKRKFKVLAESNEAVKIAKSTVASELFVASGSVQYPGLMIGTGISLVVGEDLGKFTITETQHIIEEGSHTTRFVAIPASLAVVPNRNFKKPNAEPQLGVVTDNTDPDKMGRVKVRLLWQKENATTPFIRVMSPSGGNYKDGKKTRGMFFTPEVDDYVMVGFSQNDPDRPFVMGSMPHGQSIDSASNKDNFVKSISTRSGNIITFHDKDSDKEQEIRIQTDDTNYISINLKNSDGTVKIYSSKAIEVNSKETIIVKSGKSIDVQGDKTITVKSEKISIEATDTISLKANKKIEIKAMDVAIEGSKGVEVKAGASMKVEGVQTEIAGSVTTKVSGAMLNLEGSAMTNVKGGIVKIN